MTSSAPKVTVLLACYNSEKTLERCLQSIADQTYPFIDILCVNDGSQDHTGAILQAWKEKSKVSSFQIIENPKNIGLTKSLNIGLQHVITPLCARIDADDWWEKEKIEKQISFLESHPEVGIVGTAYKNMRSSKEISVFPPETDQKLKKNLLKKNPFAHSTVVFRTSLVRLAGNYDETAVYGQDYDLWLRLAPITKFANLPEILCYRNADTGISISKQREQMWQSMKTQIKYIRKNKLPWYSYFFLSELIIMFLLPAWIKNLKRKYL